LVFNVVRSRVLIPHTATYAARVADPDELFSVAIQTPDGRIDCCPERLRRGFPVAARILDELQSEPEGQLKLISRRTNFMLNSWMHNVPALKQSIHLTNPLWMHPRDAESRGLLEGDSVEVRSDHGRIEAILGFDETLRPGVVAMTHGWGHRDARGLRTASRFPGANFNELAAGGPGSFDSLSNQCHMTGIAVDVVRRAESADLA
jgi:anaerobic selenocysteine-containing dehydrogenase